MNTSLAALLITISTVSASVALARGGMETTGGGDGVACFETAEQATVARQELRTQGFLSPKIREQIHSVVTLESWEYLQQFSKTVAINDSPIVYFQDYKNAQSFVVVQEVLNLKTADQIREAIRKNLQQYVPLFVLRLKMAEEKAPLSSWIPSTRIPEVNDSTPKVPISETSGCVLIQLANRRVISSPDRFPVTEITYDQEIFQRFLSPLDQALIMNHEYFYLIGREGNHLTSDDIRPGNTFMISESMFPFAKDKGSLGSRAVLFRQIIGYPFGDYMRFFKAEEVPQKELQSQQSSRYRALMSLMEKARASKNRSIMNNPELSDSLTPEESFLFFTRFYFDQFVIAEDVPMNSELLTYPQEDRPFTNALANLYCKLTYQREISDLSVVQEKTKRYCHETLKYSVVPGK